MLILQFDNEALGAATAFDWRRTAAADGDVEVWTLTLEPQAATADALEDTLASLRAKIGATGDLALGDSRTLAQADCREGPTLIRVDEADPAPGDVHGKRRLRLTFEATLQDSSQAVQHHAATQRVITQAGALITLQTRGRIVLRNGEDPALHESEIVPPGAGCRRVRSAITRDASRLEYETEDEQVFTPLPSGVDDGHYVISESRDAEGRLIRTLSGFFTGPGARAQALALGGEGVIRENPFTHRVDFELREAISDGGHLALTETLSFTTTRRVVDHPLLAAGAPAYRQVIGGPQTEIIQQGSAHGEQSHPSPPPPHYAADLIERQVHYSVPSPNQPPEQRWQTRWRYVSRATTEVAALAQ